MLGKTKPDSEVSVGSTAEQCCALTPSFPNAMRCTAPGYNGWHYCEEHLEVGGELIASGMIVTEIDYQSPIRRSLDS